MAGYDKGLQAFHGLIKKIFSLPDTALSSFIHLTKQRLMWNLPAKDVMTAEKLFYHLK